MTIETTNWQFDKPETNEADTSQLWADNLDAIDSALLTPAQKIDLVGGGESDAHTHSYPTLTDRPSEDGDPAVASLRTLGTGANQACAGDDPRLALTVHDNTKHSTATAVALTVGGSSAEGNSISVSRANHTHALPAFGTSAGTFAEGNDARFLTSGEKSALTSGGETSLHTHPASASSTPSGVVLPYGGSSAPSGWLLCYGQAVSRATYSTLYGVVGTAFGAGDGSTTFNLPDMRGRFPLGKDNMGGAAANNVTDAAADTIGGQEGDENLTRHNHPTTQGVENTTSETTTVGGSDYSSTSLIQMPPYLTLNYIIKT